MRKALAGAFLALVLTACGASKPAPAPTPAPPAPVPQLEQPKPAADTSAPVTAAPGAEMDIPNTPFTVTIIDLDGKPIPEVASIVTEAANAFDDPLVRGSITSADGRSDLLIPRDRETFIRGWDPTLSYFANSFISVAAGDAELPKDSTLVMAPAAQLTAQLYGADGAPAPAETQVELMFSHPEQGPWWPVRALTNAEGRILIEKVPAGKFDINVFVEGVGQVDLPAVLLMPGQLADLGVVQVK